MSSINLPALYEVDQHNEKLLRLYLDESMERMQTDNNDDYVYEMVNHLIENDFRYVHLIDHPIFIQLRDTLIDILQTHNGHFHSLCSISQLFLKTTDYINEKNVHIFQELFGNTTLVECLSQSFEHLSSTSHENLILSVGNMIDAYREYHCDHPNRINTSIFPLLVMSVVRFIKTSAYTTSFLQLSIQCNELTAFQKLILITCPSYIASFFCTRKKAVALAIAQETLNRTSEILNHFLPSIDDWNEPIIWCIFRLVQLCQFAIDAYSTSDYNVSHEKILDCILEVVQGRELWKLVCQDRTCGKAQKQAGQLFCYATLYIYAMSFSPHLRRKLKEKHITSVILKLTNANLDKTQFHAYRILAVILSSDDIKQLQNPSQITSVFITYLRKSMISTYSIQRLENLLVSLKNLIQHDQIKVDFVKHVDGLSLLIQCSIEPRFHPEKVQLRAIEILMNLTFNNEAKTQLKQNDTFVQYIRSLTTTSSIPHLKRAADGILWRLFPNDRQTTNDFQYDIMLSYSHKDKDICYQIYQALIADHFRVWIDVEGMHGVLMQTMADAIGQSRCIIMCVSDNYYLSPYCQAEAQYAFEKRRGLIPLRVQSGYKPDGWLAFLISGRLHIDFTKTTFDVAYEQLMSQMNHKYICKNRSSDIPSELSTIRSDHTVVDSYPDNILHWTPTDVRTFLISKQLHQMVPICKLMDGQTLLELYQMCTTNSPIMLQILRAETVDLQCVPLSSCSYLIFLREMKGFTEKSFIRSVIEAEQ